MNILVKLLFATCCFAALPMALKAGCEAPKQGPRGEPGPPFVVNYATAYSQGSQIIPPGSQIAFSVNRVPPVGISHVALANPFWFRVLQDGLYYVSWTFTTQSAVEQSISVNIRNVSTNTLISPVPFSVNTTPVTTGGFQTIAGSGLIPLSANTTIALEVSLDVGVEGNIAIIDPSISIFQIAPLTPEQLSRVR